MIVKTKKYKLHHNTYIKLALKNVLREQWWVIGIFVGLLALSFFLGQMWLGILTIIATILYGLFWLVQFYGVTQLPQHQLLFERVGYEITSQRIVAQFTSKQGMPIEWAQLKRAVRGKDYFLLIISKAHLIHLPHKIFHSQHEIKFITMILQRKGLA